MELTVGTDRLWYDDAGAGDVPVVLLHPGIADSTIWDRLLPLLGDHRVVRFDRRGFGRSAPATEEYTALRDLVCVLDHLGLDRAHLVGNSMGGETALALAVTEPDRVASLTLLCPGIGGYPWPDGDEDPDLVAAWTAAKQAGDAAALAQLQEGIWFRSGSDDYLREQVLRATELDFSPAASWNSRTPISGRSSERSPRRPRWSPAHWIRPTRCKPRSTWPRRSRTPSWSGSTSTTCRSTGTPRRSPPRWCEQWLARKADDGARPERLQAPQRGHSAVTTSPPVTSTISRTSVVSFSNSS